jgi:hypothetical protein
MPPPATYALNNSFGIPALIASLIPSRRATYSSNGNTFGFSSCTTSDTCPGSHRNTFAARTRASNHRAACT